MNCRNTACNADIGNRKYCPLCGFANSWLTLRPPVTPPAISTVDTEGEFTVQLDNTGFHDVKAMVSIQNDMDGMFFLKDKSTHGDGFYCTVLAMANTDIRIGYKQEENALAARRALTLVVDSDDGIPDDMPKRPRKLARYPRTQTYEIPVDIVTPGSLTIDTHFLPFGYDYRQNSFKVSFSPSSSGAADITITVMTVPPDYTIRALDSSPLKGRVLKSGDSIDVELSYGGLFEENKEGMFTMAYTSGGVNYQAEITLFLIRRASIWERDKPIPQYIVAIDFGTSKTAVAYIDTDAMYDSDGNPCVPTVEMAKLGDTGNDIPSTVVYESERYLIGKEAEDNYDEPRADYIKMSLQNETITFVAPERSTGKGADIQRPTVEVLTGFLGALKRKLPQPLQDSDANRYVFTLPVLDSERPKSDKYRRQRETTIQSAQYAGYTDGINHVIETLLESEAALFYIVNAIQAGSIKISKGLSLGDVIGVFDYGAGTLDITFGKYDVVDGRPTITDACSIGLYGDDDISLGGSQLDRLLGLDAIMAKLEDDDNAGVSNPSILLEGEDRNEDGELLDFHKFNDASPCYGGLTRIAYERGSVRPAKEQFAFTDRITQIIMERGKNVYNGDLPTEREGFDTKEFIPCAFDLFNADVEAEADTAIEGIAKALAKNDIQKVKYLFMVGGSSLLRPVGNRIKTALSGKIDEVLTPYDYAGFSSQERASLRRHCVQIRDTAVSAVVKGAVYSQITKVNKLFEYGIVVRRKDNSLVFKKFEKGESHPERPVTRLMEGSQVNGSWGVYAVLDGGREVLAASFVLNHKTPQSVRLAVEVSNRQLCIRCSVGKTEILRTKDITV